MYSIINKLIIFIYFFFTAFAQETIAQKASIEIGKTEIGQNQFFEIIISINNDKLRSYSQFPEISGFQKGSIGSSSSTNNINGRISSSQRITQNYQPLKQGTFNLKPFTMLINGTTIKSKGATIKVGKPIVRKNSFDFWGFGNKTGKPVEFIDVKDHAFFALTTNKNKVYVGEGFTLSLSFYISLNNQAQMNFYRLGEQLSEILKKIKLKNCWEENFEIKSVEPEYVTIKGEQFRKFTIYQASFFPLNDQDILFPSVGLKMIKYKVAKNPSFFGRNKQENFKTFYSAAKRIAVTALPAHPLKENVVVGNFKLIERQAKNKVVTGNSFSYKFKIKGEGNIAHINEPTVRENDNLLFYSPNVLQNIIRDKNTVFGSKSFQYFIEPQEPGLYNFSDYINWIYFSTKLERYDTLIPKGTLTVEGQSKKNASIASNDLGRFYDTMEFEDNTLQSIKPIEWKKLLTNLSIFTLISLTFFLVFKNKVNS